MLKDNITKRQIADSVKIMIKGVEGKRGLPENKFSFIRKPA